MNGETERETSLTPGGEPAEPTSSTGGEDHPQPLTQVERNYRWRKRNPEKWRTYQRELMRKRRAQAKG